MFQKRNMQQIILQNLHLKRIHVIQNMDVHAHAVNKEICPGISVLYLLRRIMILSITTCLVNC